MSHYTYETPHIIADKTIKKSVRYGEYDIEMPPSPPLKEYFNYGLKDKDQFFTRTVIPANLRTMPKEDRDRFVKEEFRRRREGIHIIIKGYPMWISGIYYFYLNYWTMEDGEKPNFCIHDLLWFYWWDMIVKDKRCFGGYDIKPRRVGDTEKALCVLYEYCSGVRSVRGGMQNKTGDDAFDNYMRLILAHQSMIWYFKPINQGTTEPKKGLKFKMPEVKVTAKGLSDEEKEEFNIYDEGETVKALNSLIDFRSSVAKAYDGKRRERYHLDEVGKMEEKDMDPIAAWGFVKPTMTVRNGAKIIGRAVVTTTVEEIKSGESLVYASTFWEESDPNQINKNGSTVSGLKRIFRDAITCGNYDDHGFPLIEENIAMIENEVAELVRQGKLGKAIEFRRKYPRTIEDALTPSAETCIFNAGGITGKMLEIQNYETPRTVVGDLVWIDGKFGGDVEFIPNINGLFELSEVLRDRTLSNKRIVYNDNSVGPGNYHRYCIGIDPYDHDVTNDGRMSKGAIAVFKKRDMLVDDLVDFGDIDQVEAMTSNRFVATYCVRRESSDLLYEDALKAAIYFGAEVFVETNKPGLRNFFRRNGFSRYLMFRPEDTLTSTVRKGPAEVGAASSTGIIDQYLEAIQVYTATFCPIVEHYAVLEDWRAFTRARRTKHDLTVATGFALLAATKKYKRLPDTNEGQVNNHWFRSIPLSPVLN